MMAGGKKEGVRGVGAGLKSVHTLRPRGGAGRSLIARFDAAFFRFCNFSRRSAPS